MTAISIVTVEERRLQCAEQNLVLAGPCWEVYGDWHEDPARRRTDMHHLLA